MKVMIDGQPAEITQWVVRADQPYNGTTQSFLIPGTRIVAYANLDLSAYEADRGYPVKVITTEELDRLDAAHKASLITEPHEQTEEEFWYSLEVLPPCKWRTVNGVELFHVSERLTGDLVNWNAQYKGRFWSFTDREGRDMAELADKVRRAANV